MRIPTESLARVNFFNRVIQNCFASRDERKNFYSVMRTLYLFGAEEGAMPDGHVNKLYPLLNLLGSFLYAQETTRFAITFGRSVRDHEKFASSINETVNDEWLSSNADFIANEAVLWSLVYNSMIVKMVTRAPDINPYLIAPHNFGVLREDIPMLDRQEACCVRYQITKTELENQLEGHPRGDEILARVTVNPTIDTETTRSPIERLLITQGPGSGGGHNVTGEVANPMTGVFGYEPKVQADMVDQYELYLYDNYLKDWRVVTAASPGVIVFDRPLRDAGWLERELPFIKFTPNPLPDYFWGRSEIECLMGSQKRRYWLTTMLQKLLALAASPPKALIGEGWTGDLDEKLSALDEPNAYIASGNPMDKVQDFRPEIPPDLWKEFAYNDEQFLEQMGLSNVMMGRGESGVRSKGHAQSLATLGSARAKKRALVIEDALEKMATLYVKAMRRFDDKTLVDDEGARFTLAQVKDDFVMKIDAHSNSPLFMEDQRQLASMLLQARAIDRKRFIQLLNPPMQRTLIDDLEKKIIPGEQQAKASAAAAAAAAPAGHRHK